MNVFVNIQDRDITGFSVNLPDENPEEWEQCIIRVESGDATIGWMHEDCDPEELMGLIAPQMSEGFPDIAYALLGQGKPYVVYTFHDGVKYNQYPMGHVPEGNLGHDMAHDLHEFGMLHLDLSPGKLRWNDR